MADSVTILGMTFEQGEVLTSAKMNQLASKVDVIIEAISTETNRSKRAEEALRNQILSIANSLSRAISEERTRAEAAEEAISSVAGTLSSDGNTITINGVEYALTRKNEAVFRGLHNGSINGLYGEQNYGIWAVNDSISSVVLGSISLLLVTIDERGYTFQYQFLGESNIVSTNYGTYIRTRMFSPKSETWSDWKYIQGEAIDSLKSILATQENTIKIQQGTIDSAVLNKEINAAPNL